MRSKSEIIEAATALDQCAKAMLDDIRDLPTLINVQHEIDRCIALLESLADALRWSAGQENRVSRVVDEARRIRVVSSNKQKEKQTQCNAKP